MESQEDQQQAPEATKKVAICGFAESYKLAPFDDPTVEVWGLNELWKYLPRWNRWFELHDDETLGVSKRDLSEGEQKRHLEWLKVQPAGNPIYMQPQFCDGRFPAAVPYPLTEMSAQFGRYFTSTIGYMLAMAIADGYGWIGLYGIDLASDVEYQQQRPNAEYFIGMAKGMGRTVVLAETSAICKAGHLYGYEKAIGESAGLLTDVGKQRGILEKKHEEALALLNTLDGAIEAYKNVEKLCQFKERGATPMGVS